MINNKIPAVQVIGFKLQKCNFHTEQFQPLSF